MCQQTFKGAIQQRHSNSGNQSREVGNGQELK